jgi:hypothetical protein
MPALRARARVVTHPRVGAKTALCAHAAPSSEHPTQTAPTLAFAVRRGCPILPPLFASSLVTSPSHVHRHSGALLDSSLLLVSCSPLSDPLTQPTEPSHASQRPSPHSSTPSPSSRLFVHPSHPLLVPHSAIIPSPANISSAPDHPHSSSRLIPFTTDTLHIPRHSPLHCIPTSHPFRSTLHVPSPSGHPVIPSSGHPHFNPPSRTLYVAGSSLVVKYGRSIAICRTTGSMPGT